MSLSAFLSAFGLGFVYFVAAIPASAALGLPVVLGALGAWLGYSSGALVVLALGSHARTWLSRVFRLKPPEDHSTWIRRIWDRWGLIGLGLLAPVTIGPQAGALLALTLGETWTRTLAALSLGVLPWCLLFSVLTEAGVHYMH